MSTFTVTNTNNSGTGSLRQAILDANALGMLPLFYLCDYGYIYSSSIDLDKV
ncbi:MAG: hypothetical protein V7L22_28990 [Nostoc sp.]|uniref:hypothetical protein n=1 Tax=Nostoc sp. TaxID=1180 RepID=UPI002FFCAEA6